MIFYKCATSQWFPFSVLPTNGFLLTAEIVKLLAPDGVSQGSDLNCALVAMQTFKKHR